MIISRDKTFKSIARYFLVTMMIFGCRPESDDIVPYLPFEDVIINLSLPQYFQLQSIGSYAYTEGGVRGIILYRKSQDKFLAFERNCTFTPNEACSTVEVEVTGIQLSDPCCGSRFNFDGNPTNGPASRQLRIYRTILSGSYLTITDEVENGI